MRNLKKFLALVLAMMMVMGLMVTANAATSFDDDANVTETYRDAVDILSALKVLQGYQGTNELKPDKNVTRAEFATILYRIYTGDTAGTKTALTVMTGYDNFTDVKGHWGETYINYAVSKGWVKGYGNGTFGPNKNVTVPQMLIGILRVLDLDPGITGSNWVNETLQLAIEEDLFDNLDDLTVAQLKGDATRELVAQIAYNAVQYRPEGSSDIEYLVKVGATTYYSGTSAAEAVAMFNALGGSPTASLTTVPSITNTLLGSVFNVTPDTKTDEFGRVTPIWIKDGKELIEVEDDANAPIIFDTKMNPGEAVGKLAEQGVTKYATTATFIQNGYPNPGTAASMQAGDRLIATAKLDDGVTNIMDQLTSSNNTVVEVYVDATSKEITKIISINTMAAKITVTAANAAAGTEANFNLSYFAGATTGTINVKSSDWNGVEYKTNDYVLYTFGYSADKSAYVIKHLEKIEPVVAKAEEVIENTSVTADGVKHEVHGAVNPASSAINANIEIGKDVDLYLDSKGNLVYAEKHVEAGPTPAAGELAYLADVNQETLASSGNPLVGGATAPVWARLLKLDGTYMDVVVTNPYNSGAGNADAMKGKFVKYTESDGKYTLTEIGATAVKVGEVEYKGDTAGEKAFKIVTGNINVTFPDSSDGTAIPNLLANKNTVFLVKVADDHKASDYKQYVGIDNVPGLRNEKASGNTVKAAVVYNKDTTVAAAIFVDATTSATDDDTTANGGTGSTAGTIYIKALAGDKSNGLVYVVAKANAATTKNASGTYKTLTVITKDGVTTMNFEDKQEAGGLFYSGGALVNAVKGSDPEGILLKSVTVENGIVTGVEVAKTGDGATSVAKNTQTLKWTADGIISVNGTPTPYADTCKVFEVKDGTPAAADITKVDVKNSSDGRGFIYVKNDGVITLIIIDNGAITTIGA